MSIVSNLKPELVKHGNILKPAALAACLVLALVVPLAIATRRNAQAQAKPSPEASPIDQKWQVFYGDIEQLEPKLHELNKQQIPVAESSVKISSDGKRFVLLMHEGDCDDCDEGK